MNMDCDTALSMLREERSRVRALTGAGDVFTEVSAAAIGADRSGTADPAPVAGRWVLGSGGSLQHYIPGHSIADLFSGGGV